MFTQLQIHYPKGSLITELVAIDRGQYIVRCLVQNEGTTLVSGMAAAQTVELAEDQARTRALAVLGIDLTTAPVQPITPAVTTLSMPAAPKDTPAILTVTPPESLEQPQLSELPASATVSEANNLFSVESKSESTPAAVPESLTTTSPTSEPTFTNHLSSTEVETSLEVETPSWMAEKLSPMSPKDISVSSYTQDDLEPDTSGISSTVSPVDFSDIIARTNVELKRLGWTNQQGRDYLVQTYGKRSRQLLRDDELLDFLQHLESEPSP